MIWFARVAIGVLAAAVWNAPLTGLHPHSLFSGAAAVVMLVIEVIDSIERVKREMEAGRSPEGGEDEQYT